MPDGMFFHTPLLYWNCSLSALENDHRILKTVNENLFQQSSAGITLRWGSVFAGKQFSHQKLIAADALVISMFYDLNSTAGELWDQRAVKVAKEAQIHKRFNVYPSNGKEDYKLLYEFRFQPLSLFDIFTLSGCYLCAAAYLFVSLRRLRAVKSKAGLVLTVLTQVATSIMSSFTILAILKVPVSHVPREVFPFVVIVIGLENMFRLINAVFATPAEKPTTIRISAALGEVGFLSGIAVGTDITIMALIARFSVPAVREFCLFAGVALMVDYILHMTFFLAVLSVDVRRLELQDSLDKFMSRNAREESSDDVGLIGDNALEKQGAFAESLFRAGSPLSTRVAGSAIIICFAVALNMHFLDNQHPVTTFLMLLEMLCSPNAFKHRPTDHAMPLNVARTPIAWLSKQDEYTGMELIRAAKHIGAAPSDAVRIIAEAYQPLFFELAGSDRAETLGKMPNIISTIDIDILKDHMQLFCVTVFMVGAAITLLMNYLLLWNDIPENQLLSSDSKGGFLKCQTLTQGHSLDIAMLATSPKGVLISIGFDRRICVWKLKGNRQNCLKSNIWPVCGEQSLWPILAITLDDKGEWLAIAPKCGKISIYQVDKAQLYRSIEIDLKGTAPAAFFFAPQSLHNEALYGPRPTDSHVPRLIIMRNDGWLFEVFLKTREIVRHKISSHDIVVSSCQLVHNQKLQLRVISSSDKGSLSITSKLNGGEWSTIPLSATTPPGYPLEPGEPCTIVPLSQMGMLLSARSCNVELVDIISGTVVRTFQTGQPKPGTLRAFHTQLRMCMFCGCPAIHSFSLCYTERESNMFMMHTFHTNPRNKSREIICVRSERDRREKKCAGFESVTETTHWLENVQEWETIKDMCVGIRRRESGTEAEGSSDDVNDVSRDWDVSLPPLLRQRNKKSTKPQRQIVTEEDEWEAWTMDANGLVATYPLTDDPSISNGLSNGQGGLGNDLNTHEGLLVSKAGPVRKVGAKSVAVGFGNNIKVLLVGQEWFEPEQDEDLNMIPHSRRGRVYRSR
ncbi:sterol-sensing domain of SREBP cleavage-activation-domain-containing protein [Pyronema omphalodes]|nr:sterol-sensing domain of SREBP cleavage-activation-domain-containing protein [Pyronema omphalodes]